MKVAVAGKGGVGKTSVVAIMARELARGGRRVLAFDFDMNPGLAISVGPLDRDPRLPSEAATASEGAQYGYTLRPELSPREAVESYAGRGPDGLRIMSFGTIDRARHDLTRTHMALREVAVGFDEVGWDVLVDLEAGTKDVYDGTYVPFVDLIVGLTDGSEAANLTCRRLESIARAQGGPKVGIVLNRSTPAHIDAARTLAARLEAPFLGSIPQDDDVRRADIGGTPVVDYAAGCPAVRAIRELATRLREEIEESQR